MSSLRSNVLFSTAAMLLVGIGRPVFNAFVTRTFGPEVNGRAAALVALIFLASLPATAALPTVMIRQVSRSLGLGREAEARGQAALAFRWAAILCFLAGAAAAFYGRFQSVPPLSSTELVWLLLGLLGYVYWRLARTLLLAVGRSAVSLVADLVAMLAMFAGLIAVYLLAADTLAIGAFLLTYLVYALWTFRSVGASIRGGELSAASRREAWRYNLLWFLGSAASLAAQQVALLLLDARVERALVGEFSLGLSLLLVLALAPRIIEVPLVHELSALGGEADRERQLKLTEEGVHWLTILSLALGFNLAMLAGPILSLMGGVSTPVVIQAFALVSLTFMAEMMLQPANNLLVAEAPPAVMTQAGVYSLVAAAVWWWSPLGEGVLGVMSGLGLSFLVKAAVVAFEVRRRFAVRIFPSPGRKLLAMLAGTLGLWGSMAGGFSPWLSAALFSAVLTAVFVPEVREALGLLLRARAR